MRGSFMGVAFSVAGLICLCVAAYRQGEADEDRAFEAGVHAAEVADSEAIAQLTRQCSGEARMATRPYESCDPLYDVYWHVAKDQLSRELVR